MTRLSTRDSLYESNSAFTGVHDPTLDKMIANAAATLNSTQANKDYDQIWSYLSQKAYSPIMFYAPLFSLSVHSVSGPGSTTSAATILWQDLRLKH